MRYQAVALSLLLAGSMMGTGLAQPAGRGERAISGPSYPTLPAQPARAAREEDRRGDTFEHQAEMLIADEINDERAAAEEPDLATNPVLSGIAEARSQQMADGAPFAHEDSQGRFIAADMVRARFGRYGAIGENILEIGGSRRLDARDFARRAVEGWMSSEGHRANILSEDYDSSGIGVAVVGDRVYATQVFRGPAGQVKSRQPARPDG